MSMPKYRWDDVYGNPEQERILPDKFYESDSYMLRLVKYKRLVNRGLQPYDPTSLQEDYYFVSRMRILK